MDRFKDLLPVVSDMKREIHPSTDGDAINALYDIAVQRKWPLPK